MLSKSGRAVPFIIKNEQSGRYQLTKQSKQLLENIEKQVSVVSVAGLYRTGKSYLLNKVILDKKGVFGVGPTVNPCTKGLWVWAEPDPTNSNRTMLIIDTEGLGALDEESNHDMKIFCLAVLLSTTFIYNSVGSIDENALQTLSLVLNLVNSIDQDNVSTKPNFIWVVRDFSLQLIDSEGKTLTSKEYLETALTSNTKQQQKSVIRKSIINAFSERDCFTLVKPLIDQGKLQNLDQIPLEELRAQFVSQSIQLRGKIKSCLRQFRLSSNSKMTGRDYAIVVQKYVHAINDGAVPNMVDTWTFIKQQKSREALGKISNIYDQKKRSVVNSFPVKKADLDKFIRNMKEEARAHFLKLTYDETSTSEVDELSQNFANEIIQLNEDTTKGFIKNVLNKQYEPYRKKIDSNYYQNFEEFEKDLKYGFKESVVGKYGERVDKIQDSYQRFYQQKLTQKFKFFQKKLKDQIYRANALKDELKQTMKKEISEINKIRDEEKKSLKQKLFDMEKRIRIMESEKDQLVDNGKAQKDLIESTCQILKRKNQEYNLRIQQLSKQVNELRTAKSELKEKVFVENKEFQKQKALFSQKEEYMNERIKELEKKNNELERKINQTGGKYENEKKSILNENQQKIKYLENQNKILSEGKADLEYRLNRAFDEAKELSEQIQSLKNKNLTQKRQLQNKILQASSNKKPSRTENQLKQQNQQLLSELQKANEKFSQANKKIKQMQEDLKSHQNSSQKQIAVHIQQIQFQQQEIKDMQERYDELKKSYQNVLGNLQDNSKTNEQSLQMKIYELSNEHQKEMNNLEANYDEKIRNMGKQIQMLQRHKQEMLLQQSLQKKQSEHKEKEWKETNNILQTMVKKLEDKIQSSEKNYQDISKEKESFYSHRIKQLEQEIEQVKERSSQEKAQNSKKSEETLQVVKQYAEMEKKQWEKRLLDDREKNDKKIKMLREDYQKKMQEEKQILEEEINELQQRLAHMDRVYNEKLQSQIYDHNIIVQKMTNQFNDERSNFHQQIAKAQQNIINMKDSHEKEINLKSRHFEQTLQNTRITLRQQFQKQIKKLTHDKSLLEEKYDSLKASNRQLQQKFLVIQNQLDKQKAVFREKERNNQIKIKQLEDKLQHELQTFNQIIENTKANNITERERLNKEIERKNAQIVRLQEQKNTLDTEFQNEKKNYEDTIRYLKSAKQKSKEDYDDMMKKFEMTIKTLSKERDKYKSKNSEEMKILNTEREKQLNDLKNYYQQMMNTIKKDKEDKMSRLVIQNRSLKDKMYHYEIEKSDNVKKIQKDDKNLTKNMEQYERRIEDYKAIIAQEKQRSKKYKEENDRLKRERSQLSDYEAHSTYQQRPSISQISNSRFYNQNYNQNQTATDIKKKFTNTPLVSKKSRVVDVDEFGGVSRFNQRTYDRRY